MTTRAFTRERWQGAPFRAIAHTRIWQKDAKALGVSRGPIWKRLFERNYPKAAPALVRNLR